MFTVLVHHYFLFQKCVLLLGGWRDSKQNSITVRGDGLQVLAGMSVTVNSGGMASGRGHRKPWG